jgi:hypothetical protein
MNGNAGKIRNPQYLWASRIAFWVTVLITLPLFFSDTYRSGTAIGNALTLLFHCYVAVANYVMGYRLDDSPGWAHWVVPSRWMREWRYLVYADTESIQSNRKGLVRVVGGAALFTVLLLAVLSGKF